MVRPFRPWYESAVAHGVAAFLTREGVMSKIKAAVVGLGYWGPNLARNFQASDDYELVGLSDLIAARLVKAGENYPAVKRFTNDAEMLAETKPDLVAVATPVAGASVSKDASMV